LDDTNLQINAMKDFSSMSEIIGFLNHAVVELESGKVSMEDVEASLEKVRELEEQLILIKHNVAAPTAPNRVAEPEVTVKPAVEPEPVKPKAKKKEKNPEPQEKAAPAAVKKEKAPVVPPPAPFAEEEEVIIDKNQTSLLDAIEEIRSSEPATLNDKMKDQSAPSLASILQKTKIQSLKKAIGINQRFAFTNQLFNADFNAFQNAIETIDSCKSLDEANQFIDGSLVSELGWDVEEKNAKEFIRLVERKFA